MQTTSRTSEIRNALLVALLVAATQASVGCDEAALHEYRQPVTISGRTFQLELAVDDAARYRGLSDRAEVPADGGMLFVFPDSDERYFVMRNCLVPIDILFLDAGGRVVATHAMQVEPYGRPDDQLVKYSSGYAAQFAIELKGGTLDTLDIRPGQKIELPIIELKRLAR